MLLLSEYLNLSLIKTILQAEIQISNYELLRYDRNRNGVGVALAILEVISVTYKSTFFGRKSKIFVLKFFSLKPNN